jgi:glycosyltransferase involved in cell wall biosynthesis
MRITMLISQFPPAVGGTERQAWLLSRELAKQGEQVEVLTQRYRSDLPVREECDGVTIRRLGISGTSLFASFVFFVHGLWVLAVQRPKPDILHAHMIAAPAVLSILASKLLHRPSVVKAACSGPYGDVATSRHTWYGKIKLSQVVRRADRIVCLTSDVEKEIADAGAPAQERVRIPNGVDSQRFQPVASPDEKRRIRSTLGIPDGRWILFVGRLAPQKRPGILLDAFMRCQNALSDAQLLFLGDGPDKERLEVQVASAGLASRIVIRSNQTNMYAYYQASDLFVLPSAAEGLSNSLLEAMASGLPCIATDHGAAGLIEDGVNGRVIPLDRPELLSAAMRELLQDPAALNAYGKAARQKMESSYRMETIASRYLGLYRELARTGA